jgi:hypothetical protein
MGRNKANSGATGPAADSAGSTGTSTAIYVPPSETVETERTSLTDRFASAARGGSLTARRAVQVAAEAALSSAKGAGAAVRDAATSASIVSGAIGRSAASAAKTTAGAVAKGAGATFNHVGDLNGDGRADAEDLRVAKAAIGKAAVELGGEAMELSRATIRHPLVKDAAAGALVGGAVAAAVPFVGVPFGAAVGAVAAVAQGTTGKVIDKSVDAAARIADKALSPKPTPKRRPPKPKPKS